MLKITETPRDAMQGIKEFIPTPKKIKFINSLLQVGFDYVDVGSFVSPRAIPQLADTAEVVKAVDKNSSKSKVMVTIGNLRGAQRAMEFDTIDAVAFPYSVSERFLHLNINTTNEKALATIDALLNLCNRHGKELMLYNAMAFGNAYGDDWSPEILAENTRVLQSIGIQRIILSDTIAVGTTQTIGDSFKLIISEFPDMEFGAHLHTTPGNWHENVAAAYDNGCRFFDTVINGKGGCPMSKVKMTGNLAGTDLLQFAKERKEKTRLDMAAFRKALLLAAFTFPQ